MRKLTLILNSAIILAASTVWAEDARTIEFHTEKKGETMTWQPEKVTVHPGEKVKLVLKHDLEGGFDFHGFTIKELKIVKRVDRHKPVTVEATIPSGVDKLVASCQFHPKHQPAVLEVKAEAKAEPAAAADAPVKKQ